MTDIPCSKIRNKANKQNTKQKQQHLTVQMLLPLIVF